MVRRGGGVWWGGGVAIEGEGAKIEEFVRRKHKYGKEPKGANSESKEVDISEGVHKE